VAAIAVFRPTCAVCFKLCRLKCALLLSTYNANMTTWTVNDSVQVTEDEGEWQT